MLRIFIGMLFALMLVFNGTCAASSAEWLQKGNEYSNRQEYQKAIDCYTSAIAELPPGYSGYMLYANRGAAYNNLGKYDKGILDATIAISEAPNEACRAHPYYVLAYACSRKGFFDQTVEYATRAIELYNERPDSEAKRQSIGCAYKERGCAHLSLKQYELAISDLQKARENDPQNSYLYFALGVSNEGIGNDDEAIHYYQECIARANPQWDEYKISTARVAYLKNKAGK